MDRNFEFGSFFSFWFFEKFCSTGNTDSKCKSQTNLITGSRWRCSARNRMWHQHGFNVPIQTLPRLQRPLHLVPRCLDHSQWIPIHFWPWNGQRLEEVDSTLWEKYETFINQRNLDHSSSDLWLWWMQNFIADSTSATTFTSIFSFINFNYYNSGRRF